MSSETLSYECYECGYILESAQREIRCPNCLGSLKMGKPISVIVPSPGDNRVVWHEPEIDPDETQ
jgi:hypothetical protein